MSRVSAAILASAAAASAALSTEHAYADNPFKSLFYTPPSLPSEISPEAISPDTAPQKPAEKEEPRPRNDNPRTTAAGFDPEALERGVSALKEINKSPNVKKVRVCSAAISSVCLLSFCHW